MIGLFLLFTYNVFSQKNEKKIYSSALDTLWSRSLYINKMTTDGKWVVLTEAFDHKENVIFLKHTADTIAFQFTKSQWIRFSDNNRWFGCINDNKILTIIDLVKFTKEVYNNTETFSFSKSGNYIAAIQQKNTNAKDLLITNLSTKDTSSIQGVTNYIWHPEKNKLLFSTYRGEQSKVGVYDLDNLKYIILEENINNINMNLLWSGSDHVAIFSELLNNRNLIQYVSLNGIYKTLDKVLLQKKFPGHSIGKRPIISSDDGKKIFFYREVKNEYESTINDVEIWDTEVPWIYPRMKVYKEKKLEQLLTVWYPETNKLVAIETEDAPTSELYLNHQYAVVYNEIQYEPLYKEFSNADIYIKNIESGTKRLIIENQYTQQGFITISPSGNQIAYFKNKHWWLYDINKNQHVNITKNLKSNFANVESDRAGDVFPFGNPGWSENDKNIILYDKYDIWLISTDGSNAERITKGREEMIKYRLTQDYQIKENNLTNNINFSSTFFNPDRGMILEVHDYSLHKTGYALFKKDQQMKTIIFEDKKVDRIMVSEDFSKVVFRKQKFNEPPVIYGIDLKNNETHLIYQSNRELMNYDLGNANIISYKIGNRILSGTLVYPSNFDQGKKYPMIVYIYEKTSNQINEFSPPSSYDYTGFNTLSYSTNGYFVLYPDIAYVISEPGVSALNCVTEAVNKSLEFEYIDKKRIGLIGHSYGGYQSAFIATHSNIFAAIVAGAAVTNFSSHYHSVGWNFNQSEIWRYENQQWRMGNSYYNIKDAYIRNSPLNHVEKITTPLLLWTGKKDYRINWMQSIEMFLAMKRLNKKGKLLLIDNEGHGIMNKTNQKILSNQIMNWFDTYCK